MFRFHEYALQDEFEKSFETLLYELKMTLKQAVRFTLEHSKVMSQSQ